MFKSTMTSKGQLTVPKEIREHLNLKTGDSVIFKIEHDKILFDKDYKSVECPVCKGRGSFSSINNSPCFICDQTGFVNAKQSPWHLISTIKGIKYGVSISVTQHDVSPDGQFIILDIPKVQLFSENYNDAFLDISCDYIQMKFIEDFAPRSVSDPDKFMIPSDVIFNEILSLVKSESARLEVTRWFRRRL